MEIYQPSEDSYFFADFLKKYLTTHYLPPTTYYLDMGTGTGILSEVASKFLDKKSILAADINPLAIKIAKQKKLNAVKTNLFEKIKTCRAQRTNSIGGLNVKGTLVPLRYDLITFNAPYLPFDPREPKSSQLATTGGKYGDEISLKFLKQAKKHLNKNGKIFLLISSLTPMNKIKKFNPKIVAKKKIFMEELLILEFTDAS